MKVVNLIEDDRRRRIDAGLTLDLIVRRLHGHDHGEDRDTENDHHHREQ